MPFGKYKQCFANIALNDVDTKIQVFIVNTRIMSKKVFDTSFLPDINAGIYALIERETGSVNDFAPKIGVKQQTLNRLFGVDAKTGKIPSVTDKIKRPILEKFGISEIDLMKLGMQRKKAVSIITTDMTSGDIKNSNVNKGSGNLINVELPGSGQQKIIKPDGTVEIQNADGHQIDARIADLERMISLKDEVIAAKNSEIETLKMHIQMLNEKQQ